MKEERDRATPALIRMSVVTEHEERGSRSLLGTLFKRGRHQLRIQIFRNLLNFTVLKLDD